MGIRWIMGSRLWLTRQREGQRMSVGGFLSGDDEMKR